MENQNPPFPPPPPPGGGNPFFNNPMGGGGQMDIPNATVILVLGICSIVICGLGPILGTIGLVLSGSAKKAYEANPSMYKEASFKNLNAGRICSIIGICVGVLVWAWYIYWLMTFAAVVDDMSHWPYRHY